MKQKITKEQSEIWRKDNANWQCAGQIYYNKEDPRILPPKRIPLMGWTVNFANTKSILAFLSITILLAGIIVLIAEKCFK